jgi:hypothetical protein
VKKCRASEGLGAENQRFPLVIAMKTSFSKRRWLLLTAVLSLAGCAHYVPTLPENYTGPQARFDDSAKVYSRSKADFFVVESIDGAQVDNSLNETLRRNHGRGMFMELYFIQRPVPAGKSMVVALKARTHYAAPILALTNSVFQVKGTTEFTPQPGKNYVVRGRLEEDYSAVWVEESDTGQVVGRKVEAQGSAKLGILEK